MNGWLFFLVLSLALVSHEASAKRLGNAGSAGEVSSSVAPRTGAPLLGADARQSASPAGVAAASTAGAAPAAARGWLGGVAAGLGLAWLATSLGWGDELAQLLLVGLAVLVLVVAAGWAVRWVRASGGTRPGHAGWVLQGTGEAAGEAVPLRSYSPANVGNDASARPWERSTTGFDAGRLPDASQAQAGSGVASVPEGFDAAGFLLASKNNFIGLQAAWDRADMATLRSMMTDDMLSQIKSQLSEHERDTGGQAAVTEVVMLDARLLGVEQNANGLVASVEFSGLIREDPSAGPSPFREIWGITRPASGDSGWLVSGVQALQ